MLTLPLTAFERRLYYMTAHNHYNAGCPDLSLQVLLDLPPPENDSTSVSKQGELWFLWISQTWWSSAGSILQ